MRISDSTRFPHPVLSPGADDFREADSGAEFQFIVNLAFQEKLQHRSLRMHHQVTLTEPAILTLVTTGKAQVGCLVRCEDTYHTELLDLSWPEGVSTFVPGVLIGRVALRPIIWLKDRLPDWDPGTIHPEFSPPVSLPRAGIVAIAREVLISVGHEKLQPIESIFELRRAELEDEAIRVQLESDRIAILVTPKIYDVISLLRGRDSGRHIVMNSVYLPAVMEVLDILRLGSESYQDRRWFRPFMAKCDACGIILDESISVLESGQKLLDFPIQVLGHIVSEGGE